jgi:hypothetical protein
MTCQLIMFDQHGSGVVVRVTEALKAYAAIRPPHWKGH